MRSAPRLALTLILLLCVVAVILYLLRYHCPQQGIAFSQTRRDFQRLKNRTLLPAQSDFDIDATLPALLKPGEDRTRWSNARAARIEGYVVALASAGVELANCYSPCGKDTHINVALRTDAPPSEQVVLEITPRMEDWARRQGWDWSVDTLRGELMGHWCSFEGWLMFDWPHSDEAENTAPRRPGNWRATAWEIHPVTALKVVR